MERTETAVPENVAPEAVALDTAGPICMAIVPWVPAMGGSVRPARAESGARRGRAEKERPSKPSKPRQKHHRSSEKAKKATKRARKASASGAGKSAPQSAGEASRRLVGGSGRPAQSAGEPIQERVTATIGAEGRIGAVELLAPIEEVSERAPT